MAAGLGCRHGVAAAAVIDLVREATARSGLRPDLLATPDFKRLEPGLARAADQLGLVLRHVGRDALRAQQPRCITRSQRVADAVGVGSIAEACALAALGAGARLALPRIAKAGVTCAIAVSDKTP